MKRSEMVEIISEFLNGRLRDYDEYMLGRKNIASNLLDILENEGMLPPVYRKESSLESINIEGKVLVGAKRTLLLNKWEKE